MSRQTARILVIATFLAGSTLARPASLAYAQGVTTSGITGIVHDSQGGVVPGVTGDRGARAVGHDLHRGVAGRRPFHDQGMRVGGPYKVTAALSGFKTETQSNVTLTLGITQDVNFTLKLATCRDGRGRRARATRVLVHPDGRGHVGVPRRNRDSCRRSTAESAT